MPENQNLFLKLSDDLMAGKVLLFNKPLYWTSFDLVNKIKRILRQKLNLKTLKIGHAGTLDPLATGLMIVCTGKETKNIDLYQSEPKEYLATLHLGATTPSFDLETAINANFPINHITQKLVEETLNVFLGKQLQMPPSYSARMVNGTRAYKLARKGQSVDLKSKEIEIFDISLLKFELPVIEIKVTCSKGTYIRSLANDIGLKLKSGAYLSALIRTGIGPYLLKNAISLEEFERNLVFL